MRKLANEELDRKTKAEFLSAEKTRVVLVLDNVRSMHNVGSVFRSADAFLVEALCLCGLTATPPHREIQKTALGATETVKWEHFAATTEAVQQLRSKGYRVYAIEQAEGSISLEDFRPGKEEPTALVFGNEVEGVQQAVIDLCDGCIEIPQFGTKHSFNISVTAGIVLWDLYSKMRLP